MPDNNKFQDHSMDQEKKNIGLMLIKQMLFQDQTNPSEMKNIELMPQSQDHLMVQEKKNTGPTLNRTQITD